MIEYLHGQSRFQSCNPLWNIYFYARNLIFVCFRNFYRKSPTRVTVITLIFDWCDVTSWIPVDRCWPSWNVWSRVDRYDSFRSSSNIAEIIRWQLVSICEQQNIFCWQIGELIDSKKMRFWITFVFSIVPFFDISISFNESD